MSEPEYVAWAVDRLGREQHGVATWHQMLAAGATPEWVEHQVRAGRLIRVGPAVYRVWGVRRSWETRAMAAVLSSRAPALVSHRSAAYLYGLDGCPTPGFIDITVPRHRRPRRRAGVTVHESRVFDRGRARVLNRIPVTGMADTLFDCCTGLDRELDRLRLLDDARRRGLVSWDELWQSLLLHAVRGRRGVDSFRHMLRTRDGEEPAHGVFVRRAAMLLEDAGLPSPVFEHPVLDYRIDMSWPLRTVGVECLGRIGHGHEAAFEADPVRRNRISLAGWLILEITWQRLITDPAAFVTEVCQALDARTLPA